MNRLLRTLAVLACTLAGTPALAAGVADRATAGPTVGRFAFKGSEHGFDPAQAADTTTSPLVSSVFESPLRYDLLARPARVKPRTTVALPEVSENHTRFVFTLKPGILFTDDPAFGGKPRELVAADYVYSVKRYYDPAVRSPTLFHYENAGLLGLSELRRSAIEQKKPFDYDTEVPGIRALDRYRFEVRTARPAPRLPYVFASGALAGAVAREVVEAHPGKVSEHPVGTGPFRLVQWRRGSRIVFERNPAYHGTWDEQPEPGDAAGRALAGRLRGRPLPLLDRVEISIIEEAQPRWLAFLKDELDALEVPDEFSAHAAPGGRLAPNLARRGVAMQRVVMPTTWYTYFDMAHPLIGGYTPERVALRRALALAYDAGRERTLVRMGRTTRAESVMPPGVSGFDPALATEMSDHDPARARALLDLYGYVDRDGDGWREQPDGQPLVLEYWTQPDQLARALQDLWRQSMTAIGVHMVFRIASWQENIKASRAGRLMIWGTGWAAALPDGSYFLDVLYGPSKGQANRARFELKRYDELVERQRVLEDGPERNALIAQAMKLSVAYMPIKATGHVVETWVTQPRVTGLVRHPFMRDFWTFVDVERRP